MNGAQRERLDRRVRRHRLRFWRGALFGLGVCILASVMSPDPYRGNPLPTVGPGGFFGLYDWCAMWGHADGRVSLGWLWELERSAGVFTHPRIHVAWIDLRSLRWALLPLATIVLFRRWASLQAWSVFHERCTMYMRSCASCGYDLTGLPAHSGCPECGSRARGSAPVA